MSIAAIVKGKMVEADGKLVNELVEAALKNC